MISEFKIKTSRYYTTQFLFKLQQFLNLQQEVYSDVSFYQSHTLNGETSKLPKLNILCKQVNNILRKQVSNKFIVNKQDVIVNQYLT